jgi:hypothetical protein
MNGLIDCEAAQDHHWNRVWHIASYSSRRIDVSNGAYSQCVIPDDFPPYRYDVRAGSSARLILHSTASQPVIEHRLTGIEWGQIMRSGQLLGRADRASATHRSQGAFE